MARNTIFLGILVCLLWGMGFATVQAQQSNWLPSEKLIYGQNVDPAFLQGKVYLVEYWGIHCGPCVAAMPKLRDLQSQYGPSGLFYIVGSHVQDNSDEVKTFLNSNRINFPVYQSVYNPLAQPQGGIPHSALFDCKGNLVAQGHPAEVVSKIPELLEQAIQLRRLTSGPLPHPLASLNIGKKAMELFSPGKPWAGPYKKLKKEVDKGNTDMETALSTLDSYIADQCQTLSQKAQEAPAANYEALVTLRKSLKGMDQEKDLAEIVDPLTKDKNVKDLAQIIFSLNKLEYAAREGALKESAIKKKAESFSKNLNSYLGRVNLDPKLEQEAKTVQKKAQAIAEGGQMEAPEMSIPAGDDSETGA